LGRVDGGGNGANLHHELGVGGAVFLLLEFPAEFTEHIYRAVVGAFEGAICDVDSGGLGLLLKSVQSSNAKLVFVKVAFVPHRRKVPLPRTLLHILVGM
jgi:hypothetical protein